MLYLAFYRLLWWVCIAMLNRLLYAPSAAQLAKQYGLQPVTWVEYENKHRPPVSACSKVFYCISLNTNMHLTGACSR
jgi:hypothetical protein